MPQTKTKPKPSVVKHGSRTALERSVEQALADVRAADNSRREVQMMDVSPITALRRRLGYTQEEFARIFQVAPATIRNWEQGRRKPSGAAPSLLKVIEAMPDKVREVLDRRDAVS